MLFSPALGCYVDLNWRSGCLCLISGGDNDRLLLSSDIYDPELEFMARLFKQEFSRKQ